MAHTEIDPAVLTQAADWLVKFQSGEATAQDHEALQQWCALNPEHEAAWQRAERLLGDFEQVPAQLGRDALSRTKQLQRRRALLLLLLGAPSIWAAWRYLPWQEWRADLRTAIGQQKNFDLADGSQVMLNTASAVDVVFSNTERRLQLLEGEILITTATDSAPIPRPFIVTTAQGSLQALGTQFNVRRLDRATTEVKVLQGAVEVRPLDISAMLTLKAGQQVTFTSTDLPPPQAMTSNIVSWSKGMLLAQDMLLGDLVAELARYQWGVLRCDPQVADLLVSGAFPVNNVAASLGLLEKTLPVKIIRTTPWWVMVSLAG